MARPDLIKKGYRDELIEKLATEWLNVADMKTLEEHYYNSNVEYLDDIDDDQLLEHCEDMGIDLTDFLEKQ